VRNKRKKRKSGGKDLACSFNCQEHLTAFVTRSHSKTADRHANTYTYTEESREREKRKINIEGSYRGHAQKQTKRQRHEP